MQGVKINNNNASALYTDVLVLAVCDTDRLGAHQPLHL